MEFAEQLLQRRLELNLTQVELARAVGCDRRRICDYERRRRLPDPGMKRRLAVMLRLPRFNDFPALSVPERRLYAVCHYECYGEKSTEERIRHARYRDPELVNRLLRGVSEQDRAALGLYPLGHPGKPSFSWLL